MKGNKVEIELGTLRLKECNSMVVMIICIGWKKRKQSKRCHTKHKTRLVNV